MSIYTKKGDTGQTSLYGGRKVSKSIVRLEAIGCIDETNSLIGIIIAELQQIENLELASLNKSLERIQGELLAVGADIATPYSASSTFQKNIDRVDADLTKRLEIEIDEMDKSLEKLRFFILPGGHEVASYLQQTRAVARRAERNIVRLQKGAKVNTEILKYINRLSDWLFTASRFVNAKTKTLEKRWE